ncbi:hypothetical protein SNEBB_002236 [Seison nebaliae]|nr:hypothetical protein SNEBB_002236 [Seison nebaliae]
MAGGRLKSRQSSISSIKRSRSRSRKLSKTHMESQRSSENSEMKENMPSYTTLATRLVSKKISVTSMDDRLRQFGKIFQLKTPEMDGEILKNAIHKVKLEYNQVTLLKASKVYGFLKETKEVEIGNYSDKDSHLTEGLDIRYDSPKQKENVLRLAFRVLKFQWLIEKIMDETEFYTTFPDFSEYENFCTIIAFDSYRRKFTKRNILNDEEKGEEILYKIEDAVNSWGTKIAASIARNRIDHEAQDLDSLASNKDTSTDLTSPVKHFYAWINFAKSNAEEVTKMLEEELQLKSVEESDGTDEDHYFVDPNFSSLLMFDKSVEDKLESSKLITSFKLIIDSRTTYLTAYTTVKLLNRQDPIIVTNVDNGYLPSLIASLSYGMNGIIHTFTNDISTEKFQEIQTFIQKLGYKKTINLHRENFISTKNSSDKWSDIKVITINVDGSTSGIKDPVDYFVRHSDDFSSLKTFADLQNGRSNINSMISRERELMLHAMTFRSVSAIVYMTTSINTAENSDLVNACLKEFRTTSNYNWIFKPSPPLIPIDQDGIEKHMTFTNYYQAPPTSISDGIFLSIFARTKRRKHHRTESLETSETESIISSHTRKRSTSTKSKKNRKKKQKKKLIGKKIGFSSSLPLRPGVTMNTARTNAALLKSELIKKADKHTTNGDMKSAIDEVSTLMEKGLLANSVSLDDALEKLKSMEKPAIQNRIEALGKLTIGDRSKNS